MNNEILELEKQAANHYWSLDDETRNASAYTAKFAELIIDRCVSIADQCREDEWFDVGGAIKEHFGVK